MPEDHIPSWCLTPHIDPDMLARKLSLHTMQGMLHIFFILCHSHCSNSLPLSIPVLLIYILNLFLCSIFYMEICLLITWIYKKKIVWPIHKQVMVVSGYVEVSRHSTFIVRDSMSGKYFGKIVDKSIQPAVMQSPSEGNQTGIRKLEIDVNIL